MKRSHDFIRKLVSSSGNVPEQALGRVENAKSEKMRMTV